MRITTPLMSRLTLALDRDRLRDQREDTQLLRAVGVSSRDAQSAALQRRRQADALARVALAARASSSFLELKAAVVHGSRDTIPDSGFDHSCARALSKPVFEPFAAELRDALVSELEALDRAQARIIECVEVDRCG